jgi:hypothetical protein
MLASRGRRSTGSPEADTSWPGGTHTMDGRWWPHEMTATRASLADRDVLVEGWANSGPHHGWPRVDPPGCRCQVTSGSCACRVGCWASRRAGGATRAAYPRTAGQLARGRTRRDNLLIAPAFAASPTAASTSWVTRSTPPHNVPSADGRTTDVDDVVRFVVFPGTRAHRDRHVADGAPARRRHSGSPTPSERSEDPASRPRSQPGRAGRQHLNVNEGD